MAKLRKKGKVIKVSQHDVMKWQQDKAIRESRLFDWCFSHYGQELTEQSFCPECEFREICEQQRKRRAGRNNGK